MKQIDATAHCDHGRKVHVHGYPLRNGNVAIVLQTSTHEASRYISGGQGFSAYMTRAEARKLNRALTRILKGAKRAASK